MKKFDREQEGVKNEKTGLTEEQKSARRELIQQCANNITAREKKTCYDYLGCNMYSDYYNREVEELMDLGFSKSDAIRSASRCYKRGNFYEFED